MSSTNENVLSKYGTEPNGKQSDLGKDLRELSKITGVLATDAVNLVQKNASQYYDQGLKQAKKFEKSVEGRIQSHPLQSLMIVAGVGLVLGALWNRR